MAFFRTAVAAFILCLALAGCAAMPAPVGAAPQTPRLDGEAFVTHDGLSLPLRHWDAQGQSRAVIVALHGMSDYANAFAGSGRQWADAGITTLAFDQRGFGSAPGPGSWSGGEVMRADLANFVGAAKARYPGVPVFALGESMGGAVVLSALEQENSGGPLPVAGVILVAPAVWARRDMPLSYRVALFLAAHLTPGLILSNSAASHVVTIVPSDNVAMLRALARDPLFQKQTRADALFGLVNLMDEAHAAADKLGAAPPILLMTGDKDQVIPHDATNEVIAALDSRATVRRYPQGYHMLLRDLEGPAVNKDVADWVLARVGEPLAHATQ
jgi:alpha-beta hydrolase superfamily lysophospholipase